MARNHQHNPDPNVNAARIVRETTGDADSLPRDVEAAWAAWSVEKRGRNSNQKRAASPFLLPLAPAARSIQPPASGRVNRGTLRIQPDDALAAAPAGIVAAAPSKLTRAQRMVTMPTAVRSLGVSNPFSDKAR
jgi:hypothetical protein